MSDVQVLRRAVRWDLTSPTFSSRAVVADMKLKMPPQPRIKEVAAKWKQLALGKYKIES